MLPITYDGLLYEEWAAESLTYANRDVEPEWADAYEEMASELLSLANLATANRA